MGLFGTSFFVALAREKLCLGCLDVFMQDEFGIFARMDKG